MLHLWKKMKFWAQGLNYTKKTKVLFYKPHA